jgi:hypothetical protein
MTKYQALDPNVEVLGAAIMSVVSSLGEEARSVLRKHNIDPLNAESWYKQQDWLNAFADLSERNFLNLVAIGMKIPDEAVWPPDVKTVHDALASINVAYGMNHRGGEIGGYHYQKTGERTGAMVCDNPYPSDFDYGIIYRTAQKFRDSSSGQLIVRLDKEKPTRKDGDKSCTYLITW